MSCQVRHVKVTDILHRQSIHTFFIYSSRYQLLKNKNLARSTIMKLTLLQKKNVSNYLYK